MDYCETAYNFAHLGLGYIAAVLEDSGIQADIYECMGMDISPKELCEVIQREHYRIVGISTYVYNSHYALKIVRQIRKIDPSIFVFLGGYYATLCHESILTSVRGVDCCVLGEGEHTCLELVKAVATHGHYKDIAGLAYLEDGVVVRTAPRPLVDDLDTLPFPRRAFISKKKRASMVTSRGCYGHCSFCSIRAFYKGLPGRMIRMRTAENVVAEIEHLVRDKGVEFLNFYDDNFLVSSSANTRRVARMCQLIRDRKIPVSFSISARATDVIKNRELLPRLKEAGLQYVFVGVETMDQRQLEFLSKNTTVEENAEAIKVLAEVGLKVAVGFIMLDPFSTIEEVSRSIVGLKETGYFSHMADAAFPLSQYSVLQVVHGTPFHELMKSQGSLVNNEVGYEFVDEAVRLFYRVRKAWAQNVYPVNLATYALAEAEELGWHDIADEFRREKRKLVELDVEFLLDLCARIQRGLLTEAHVEAYVLNWARKLAPIQESMALATDMLRQSTCNPVAIENFPPGGIPC